jgi:thiol-disulfide isomerase/thioredoxin
VFRRLRTRRRSFLASAVAVGLAGCLGDGGGGGADAADDTIETLDVGGSSGDVVPVKPQGRVALLDFWATWCAPCKPQMAEHRTVRDRFPDLHLLSITNESDREPVEAFWLEFGGRWAVAMDPELRTNDRFDVTRIPTLLVVDGDGTELWRHTGLAAAETIAEQLEKTGL